jgi:hypothetical protein
MPKSIPDNNATGITSSIPVVGNGTVALLSLSLNITHTFIGDLVVTLISLEAPRSWSSTVQRQRAAQRRGLGSGRDKLHGRVVQCQPVVEMARTVIVIRRSTDETRAQTRAASARVRVLSGAPQNSGGSFGRESPRG